MKFAYGIDKLKSKLKDVDFYRIILDEYYSENLIAKEGTIDSITQNDNFGLSIFYTLGKFAYFYSTNNTKDLDNFKIDLAYKKYSNLDYVPKESCIKDKKIIGKKSDLELEEVAKELSKTTKLRKKIISNTSSYKYDKINRLIINENTEIEQTTHYGYIINLLTAKDKVLRSDHNRTAISSALNKRFYDFTSKQEEYEKELIKKLNYKEGISGTYDVILDPTLTGLLAHEAIGHACEADLVYNKQSILNGKLGQKFGKEIINLYDNPENKEDSFGSLYYDDEGFPAKNKHLIKNGKLNEFITNTRYSQLMNLENNGGSRAESFNDIPIPRMSNTHFGFGNKTLDELIEEMNSGIILSHGAGGQVDPALGTYQFGVRNAKIIKNGKEIENKVNLSFSGNILESLKNISAISKDYKCRDPGFCGKASQTIRVTDYGPYLLIKNVRLG